MHMRLKQFKYKNADFAASRKYISKTHIEKAHIYLFQQRGTDERQKSV